MSIRIVVADDQEIVREGFAALLATQPDLAVAGTAADGEEAVRVCESDKTDSRSLEKKSTVAFGRRC